MSEKDHEIKKHESEEYISQLNTEQKNYQWLEGEEKEKKAAELLEEFLDKVKKIQESLEKEGANKSDIYFFFLDLSSTKQKKSSSESLERYFSHIPIKSGKNNTIDHDTARVVDYIREEIANSDLSADDILEGVERLEHHIDQAYAEVKKKLLEREGRNKVTEIRKRKTEDEGLLNKLRKFFKE